MNKAFKLLFALFLSFPGLAQNPDSAKWDRFTNLFDNPYKTFEASKILSFKSTHILSSQNISNTFIYPFVLGKKLEKEAIDNNLENTENKQLVIEQNSELCFINLEKNLLNNPTLNWYIKGGNHHRTYINSSNDAMRLIFKGNTDSSAYEFNNCNYYNLRSYKIGGGLYHHKDKVKQPYNLSFGVFVNQALNYGNIKTFERNYLQGTEDSFLIGANYDAEFASAKAFSGNGLGVGMEFIFNQKINDHTTWGFGLENFGFANFKEKSTTYTANGEYRFDGVYISDIGRVGEDDYFKNQLDSFTNQLTNKKENQTRLIWIAPVSFIYYNIHLKSGYYQLAMRHSGTRALPVVEVGYFRFLIPSLLWGAKIGGIGQYYLNTDINWAIGRQWFLQAGIYHLEALALPKTFGGLGGNFGLQFVF